MSHTPHVGGTPIAPFGRECDMNPLSPTPHAQDILDVAGLAARYYTSAGYIRKLHSKQPSRLPPRLDLGGRNLLWRLVDIEAWEAAKAISTPASSTPARRGPKSTTAKAAANRVSPMTGVAA